MNWIPFALWFANMTRQSSHICTQKFIYETSYIMQSLYKQKLC